MLENFIDKGTNAVASDTPTINKEIGTVTPATTAIAGLASRTITVTNSKVSATSIILAIVKGYGGAGVPVVQMVLAGVGSFTVELVNTHATAATDESIVFDFIVF